MYITDDMRSIYVTIHSKGALKTAWHHQTQAIDCGSNTHTRLMATELTFSWVTSRQRSDLSSLPPSLHSTLGSCSHMAGMSQGAPKQGMQGERDEGMQRRCIKWRTKALFGLKDELLCWGTVCWSRTEELVEREIWGQCGVLLSLCPRR